MNKTKMRKRFLSLNRHQADGFTLVELIVVIAILAILGGVAVPAYSGYVQKAEEAADQALLAEVNTAFAAACAMNGENHIGINATATLIDKKVTAVSHNNDAFMTFFDSKDAAFKTVNGLYYNKYVGMFEFGVSSGDGSIVVSKDAVDKILNSSLGKNLSSDEIVTMLGTTNDYILAKPMYFDNILADDSFADLADKALGEGGYSSAISAEAEKLAKEAGGYRGNWEDLDPEDKEYFMGEQMAKAEKNVGSKVAVLVAAQGAAAQKDTVLAGLQSTPSQYIENLKASMNKSEAEGGDPITGLSQAAVAYGLYASYMTSQGKTPDPVSAWEDMKTNTGFHDYLADDDVQADMDGFMASMDTLAGLDSTTANKIAQSGVDDAGLQQALKDILGK